MKKLLFCLIMLLFVGSFNVLFAQTDLSLNVSQDQVQNQSEPKKMYNQKTLNQVVKDQRNLVRNQTKSKVWKEAGKTFAETVEKLTEKGSANIENITKAFEAQINILRETFKTVGVKNPTPDDRDDEVEPDEVQEVDLDGSGKHLPKKSCMNNKSSSQGQHYSILVNNENSMNATIRLFAKSGKKEEFTVPSKDIISYSTCMVNQKLTIFAKKGGDDSSSSFKRVSTVRARPGGQKSFRIKAEVKPISATP